MYKYCTLVCKNIIGSHPFFRSHFHPVGSKLVAGTKQCNLELEICILIFCWNLHWLQIYFIFVGIGCYKSLDLNCIDWIVLVTIFVLFLCCIGCGIWVGFLKDFS